jgi:hypothetical protein
MTPGTVPKFASMTLQIIQFGDHRGGKLMSNAAENAFVEATDKLIRLYRGVERNTLDLPWISVMPTLIYAWAILRFNFFLLFGIFLILPTNLVILIRNLFPGHWRYRPFFLHHLYYVWLWVWRGEAPTTPGIFVRPLLNVFMKGHFQRRLRRLRIEILLSDEVRDATRSTLLARLDAALERWKSPQFAAIFYTVLLPTIASFPNWYKQLTEFLGLFEIHMPASVAVNFVSENMSTVVVHSLGAISLGYLFAIPITAFLAKRGLFLGADTRRICFPGRQGGCGVYSKEEEILGRVGLHEREAPIDLWLLGVSFVLGLPMLLITLKDMKAIPLKVDEVQFLNFENTQLQIITLQVVVLVGLFFVAALRRGRTGRT